MKLNLIWPIISISICTALLHKPNQHNAILFNLFSKNQASTIIGMSLLFLNPQQSLATPLGDHTVCAYPACTSQKDILLNSAPNLASKSEKETMFNTLKTIQGFIREYPEMIENGDYLNVRSRLRSMPVSQLRLTARKMKIFLSENDKPVFAKAYDTMIDNFDTVDVQCGRAITGGSDENMKASIRDGMRRVISSFDDMLLAASSAIDG